MKCLNKQMYDRKHIDKYLTFRKRKARLNAGISSHELPKKTWNECLKEWNVAVKYILMYINIQTLDDISYDLVLRYKIKQ